jgi:hypothetical protein
VIVARYYPPGHRSSAGELRLTHEVRLRVNKPTGTV